MTKLPRWRSVNPDGVAHAYPSRQLHVAALCGAKNAEERYDRPKKSHCGICLVKAADLLNQKAG